MGVYYRVCWARSAEPANNREPNRPEYGDCMSYEDRDVCFAPVFGARSFIVCFLLNITIVPVLLTTLLVLYPFVFLLTLARRKPREEVACALKRLWFVATHCGKGNDDSTLVL